MSAHNEIDKLAQYLLKYWYHEIGANDSESAVEVAIRLLERLRLESTSRPEVDPETT